MDTNKCFNHKFYLQPCFGQIAATAACGSQSTFRPRKCPQLFHHLPCTSGAAHSGCQHEVGGSGEELSCFTASAWSAPSLPSPPAVSLHVVQQVLPWLVGWALSLQRFVSTPSAQRRFLPHSTALHTQNSRVWLGLLHFDQSWDNKSKWLPTAQEEFAFRKHWIFHIPLALSGEQSGQ